MALDRELNNLRVLYQRQQAIIDKQNVELSNVNRKLSDLRVKLLATQSSIISKEVTPEISPIEILKLQAGSNVAVYSFGGMQTRLGMPPREFMRSLQTLNVSQVFFKDFFQCWYHKGLLGHTSSLNDTIEFIKQFKQDHSHEHVVTVGTSAGGYAAIVFGVAIGAKKILSFVPQTQLKENVLEDFKSIFSSSTELNEIDQEFLDLKTFLQSQTVSSEIQVFFGEECLPDKHAAEHIRMCENVHLYPVKGAEQHGQTLRILKSRGKLDSILQRAVAEVINDCSLN